MRPMLIIAAAIFLMPIVAPGQQASRLCPTLSIRGPSGPVKPGEIGTYMAHVDTRGLNITPSFKWRVIRGTIISGQGTGAIEVRNPTDWTTTVTVEVIGFPLGCPNESSESST